MNMQPVYVPIEERLRAEIKAAREGLFTIGSDRYGNRTTGRSEPDPDLADLLQDALTEIQKAKADANTFREMAVAAERSVGEWAEDCEKAVDAVRLSSVLLRQDLRVIIESESRLEREPDGDGWRPIIEPLDDPDAAAWAAEYVRALRAIKKVIDFEEDDCPAWVDEIIDGTRRI